MFPVEALSLCLAVTHIFIICSDKSHQEGHSGEAIYTTGCWVLRYLVFCHHISIAPAFLFRTKVPSREAKRYIKKVITQKMYRRKLVERVKDEKAYYQMHKKGTQRTLLIISTPATDISGGRC